MSPKELSVAGLNDFYVLDTPGDHKTRFRRRAKARPHPHLELVMPKDVTEAERKLKECWRKDIEAGAVVLQSKDGGDQVIVVEKGRAP